MNLMQLVNVASITVRNLFPAKSVLHSARREICIAALRAGIMYLLPKVISDSRKRAG